MEFFETRNIQEQAHTPGMSPLQVCRGYAKHGVCPFPDTCIYDHPPPPTILPPSVPNLASAHAWEAAGQYFEPMSAGNQGPVCQSWIQSGSCPYGPSCQFTHPPLAVQFPGKPPLPPVFPTSPQQMMYPSFLPPHSKLPANLQMVEPNSIPGLSPLPIPTNAPPPGPPGLMAPMGYGNPAYPPMGHFQPHHHQMGRGYMPHRRGPPQLCKNWNKGCKFGENCRFYHPPPGENPPMIPPQFVNNIYMEPPAMEIKHSEDGVRAPVPTEIPQQQTPPIPQPHQAHPPQPQGHQPQPQPQFQSPHPQPQPQAQPQQPPQAQNPRHQSPTPQNENIKHTNGTVEKEVVPVAHVEQKHGAPAQAAPATERTGKKKRSGRKPGDKKGRKEDGNDKAPQSAPSSDKKDADPKKEAELDQKIEMIRLQNAQSEARHNEVMADKARAKEQEDIDRRANRREDGPHPHSHSHSHPHPHPHPHPHSGSHHRRPHPGSNAGPHRSKDNSNNDHPKKHYPSEKHYTETSNGHQHQPQHQHQHQQHQPQHAQGQQNSSGGGRSYGYHSNSPRSHPHPRPVKTYVPTQPRNPPASTPASTPAPAVTPAPTPVTNGR